MADAPNATEVVIASTRKLDNEFSSVGHATALPAAFDGLQLHAGVIALAYRAHRTADNASTFGHVKAEKITHLAEATGVVDLGRQPTKQAAGPADLAQFERVREYAEANRYFRFVARSGRKKGYTFEPLSEFDSLIQQMSQHLDQATLKPVLDLLVPVKSSEAELLATAYAAWNNLLLDGEQPSDAEIVRAARDGWHADKMKYTESQFKAAICKLRQARLVPDGSAKRVGEKPQAGLWDQPANQLGHA